MYFTILYLEDSIYSKDFLRLNLFYNKLTGNIPIEIRDNNPNISNNNEVLISYNMKDARDLFERNYIVTQLARFNGNISKTAEFIGMERTALHRKLKYLGIDKRT